MPRCVGRHAVHAFVSCETSYPQWRRQCMQVRQVGCTHGLMLLRLAHLQLMRACMHLPPVKSIVSVVGGARIVRLSVMAAADDSRGAAHSGVGLEGLAGHPTQRQWDICFGLYVFSECDAAASLAYMAAHGYRYDDRLAALLDSRFLNEDMDTIASIQDPDTNWKSQYTAIVKEFIEYHLSVWVEEENGKAGVAPAYGAVFRRYQQMRLDMGWPLIGYNSYHSQKTWVQRWMKKWSAARSMIRTHVASDPDEVASKVR